MSPGLTGIIALVKFLLLAQVGIFPGHMAKICPHTSTGRADYFGPAVNRAARLLCAAKGGQVLVG